MTVAGIWAAGLAALVLAGCGGDDQIWDNSAIHHGNLLFHEVTPPVGGLSVFSCATCHATAIDPNSTAILPGANLAGVTARKTFWGGQERALLRAINDCRFYFMNLPQPWGVNDDEARAIYAYLAILPAELPNAVTFTVVASVADLPAGDPARGASVHARACGGCHGEMHTGDGRLASIIPILPEDPALDHRSYPHDEQRVVFIEKLRHGTFFGYGGDMPPFSPQVLPDADVSDLLAAYGLY